jgi:hypothetical protein
MKQDGMNVGGTTQETQANACDENRDMGIERHIMPYVVEQPLSWTSHQTMNTQAEGHESREPQGGTNKTHEQAQSFPHNHK